MARWIRQAVSPRQPAAAAAAADDDDDEAGVVLESSDAVEAESFVRRAIDVVVVVADDAALLCNSNVCESDWCTAKANAQTDARKTNSYFDESDDDISVARLENDDT